MTVLGPCFTVRLLCECGVTPSLYLAAYTSFESQNGSRSGWQGWCVAASVALLPAPGYLVSDLQRVRVSDLNARR